MVYFTNVSRLCAAFLVLLLSPMVISLGHYGDMDKSSCDHYCLNAGQCTVNMTGEVMTETCLCFTLEFVLDDGREISANFTGHRCQHNFHQCLYNSTMNQCMKDPEAVYRDYQDKILNKKFKSACKLLDEAISCIKVNLKKCSDLTNGAELAKEFETRIGAWTDEQRRFCRPRKNAPGDDCCGRNCKKFDSERLCQCNNACRRYGDCCRTKSKLCKWRKANNKNFFADAPERMCKRKDGKPCQEVQIKSNETMVDMLAFFSDIHMLSEAVSAAVNESIIINHRPHGYIPRHHPGIHINESEVAVLQSAYVKEEVEVSEIEDEEFAKCGNCTRVNCADPCPSCPCEQYPDAKCMKDACILEPCDSSLPCVARWFHPTSSSEVEDEEVTIYCKDTPNNCHETT